LFFIEKDLFLWPTMGLNGIIVYISLHLRHPRQNCAWFFKHFW